MRKFYLFVLLHCFFLPAFVVPLFSQSYDFIEDQFHAIDGNAAAERKIWERVNTERKKAGLNELSYDAVLQSAARQHAQEMLRLKYFSHTSPVEELKNPTDRVYRSGLTDYTVGENIAVHSQDGTPEAVAEQLMDQWMKSPGHRANILRPEFTHIGVGVISFKDSVVKDTLVKGARGRLVVYTIRHYGTQVFASRDISFSKLILSKSASDFLMVELQFEFDRSALASFNNYTQFFQPIDNKINMHVEYPLENQIRIYLARIQNDYTKEYSAFFQDDFTKESILKTLDKLSLIPIPFIKKEIRIENKTSFFLEGEGIVTNHAPKMQCLINIDNDRYYEIDPIENRLRFKIPIEADGKIKKISWAVGSDREKPVRNYLMINTKELNKSSTAGAVFMKN